MATEHIWCWGGRFTRRWLCCTRSRRGANPSQDLPTHPLEQRPRQAHRAALGCLLKPRCDRTPRGGASSPGADLSREAGGCSHADQRQTGREEPPVCPSVHLSVRPGCTYHIPEERIEDNGKDGSHKVGFREVHVAKQPGHNAEVCLKGQSGISGRRACPTWPTWPTPERRQAQSSETKLPSRNRPVGSGASKSGKRYYSVIS